MLRFIARRLMQMVPVLFVIATLTFFMIRLAPGGPFDTERNTTPEIQKSLDRYYGLNLPVYQQYFRWLGNALHGDLGPSFRYANRTVNELIAESFPMVGISVPNFVLGPLLVLIFALKLNWLHVSGWESATDRILPAVTLGALYAAYIARLTRGGMLEILSQDFIRTARAKGASNSRVILKHALRGGLLPVVNYLGPAAAALVTGSFAVETIFQIPGLGRNFVNAAFNRDYTMVLGAVLFYAGFIVLFNLIVDVVLVWMDPKQKFE